MRLRFWGTRKDSVVLRGVRLLVSCTKSRRFLERLRILKSLFIKIKVKARLNLEALTK